MNIGAPGHGTGGRFCTGGGCVLGGRSLGVLPLLEDWSHVGRLVVGLGPLALGGPVLCITCCGILGCPITGTWNPFETAVFVGAEASDEGTAVDAGTSDSFDKGGSSCLVECWGEFTVGL